MSSFFWVMSVMLLTFVFAFLLLFDQPFSLDGLGATMWYVYMHGIFGDADDAPDAAAPWRTNVIKLSMLGGSNNANVW